MGARLAALIAAALLAGTAAVALASHVEPAPTGISYFVGHDSAGKVSFSLVMPPQPVVLNLRFANSCAPKGSSVASIPVEHDLFRYDRGSFDVAGSFDGEDTSAHGTLRVHTATCDSGTLSFTAKS